MGLIHDPGAAKRSLMYKQKSLCNGEKTGRCCAFYWAHWEKVESNNPDSLRKGEIFRVCTFSPDIAHEMSAEQLGTRCNQYKPMRLPWWKRPFAWLGLIEDPGKFDAEFEAYHPLTPEEIRELQERFPTMPDANQLHQESLVQLKKEAREAKGLSLDEAMEEIGNNDNSEDQGIFAKEGE